MLYLVPVLSAGSSCLDADGLAVADDPQWRVQGRVCDADFGRHTTSLHLHLRLLLAVQVGELRLLSHGEQQPYPDNSCCSAAWVVALGPWFVASMTCSKQMCFFYKGNVDVEYETVLVVVGRLAWMGVESSEECAL